MPKPIKFESLGHELHARGFLSVPKMQKYLRQYHPNAAVSQNTLDRHVKQGKLDITHHGGVRVVHRAEIERYIKSRENPND